MPQLFTNNACALLASGITDTATSLTVEAAKADLFPTANVGTGAVPSVNNWFKATLQDAMGNVEIIYVRTRNAGSGVMSDVLRGQEGTIAKAFTAGSVVGVRITAADAQAAVGAAFPSGTRLPFAQAAAPTGWTQDTSDNATNRMLRVVNTAGGGVGGSASPILNNVVPAHTHGFTTGTVSADHTHGFTTGVNSNNHEHNVIVDRLTSLRQEVGGGLSGFSYSPGSLRNDYLRNVRTDGVSANHTHSGTTGGISANHTHSGTTDNGSSQTNWQPRYIDMIICSKD